MLDSPKRCADQIVEIVVFIEKHIAFLDDLVAELVAVSHEIDKVVDEQH